jgi:phosphoglycolate phosphatase
MPHFKGILFDKDGTLVSTLESWIRLESLLAKGLLNLFHIQWDERYLTEFLWPALGYREGRLDPQGLLACGTEEAILEAFFFNLPHPETLGLKDFLSIARNVLQNLLTTYSPVAAPCGDPQILYRLKDTGIILGVATGDTLANTQRDLTASNMGDAFLFWACCDTITPPKPSPFLIKTFCQNYDLTPDQVLVVGDTPSDRQMAQLAGASFAAVLSGAGTKEDLLPALAWAPNFAMLPWEQLLGDLYY